MIILLSVIVVPELLAVLDAVLAALLDLLEAQPVY